jgi:ribonuclease HI
VRIRHVAAQCELPLTFNQPTTPYIVYTDGSCWPNPNGPGGWCAIVLVRDKKTVLSGRLNSTTNNRAELQAVIEGLRYIPEGAECVVRTDSQYVQKGAMFWHRKWERKRYEGVKNPDLWVELIELKKLRKCVFEWVRGHNGDELNEECDRVANAIAQGDSVHEFKDELTQ